ncbi:unnamed protein product, partial [Closterium sp. NIES-54]
HLAPSVAQRQAPYLAAPLGPTGLDAPSYGKRGAAFLPACPAVARADPPPAPLPPLPLLHGDGGERV